jgi:hypothetical protein
VQQSESTGSGGPCGVFDEGLRCDLGVKKFFARSASFSWVRRCNSLAIDRVDRKHSRESLSWSRWRSNAVENIWQSFWGIMCGS